MDYYNKYTKYIELKYNYNQYGGSNLILHVMNQMRYTFTPTTIEIIFILGHNTSNILEKIMEYIMNAYKIRKDKQEPLVDVAIKNIKDAQEALIDKLISSIDLLKQDNKFYTNIFSKYTRILKLILNAFIDRYYHITMTPLQNPPKAAYVIPDLTKPFHILFWDYKSLLIGLEEPDNIIDEYLCCNLLSICFFNYKVSFTNYYNIYDFTKTLTPEIAGNIMGILIYSYYHKCCLFINNDVQYYYNYTQMQLVAYDWVVELQNVSALYITPDGHLVSNRKSSLLDEETIKTYSKVLYITIITKYTKDTLVDTDITSILTNIDTIKPVDMKDEVMQYMLANILYIRYKFKNLRGLKSINFTPLKYIKSIYYENDTDSSLRNEAHAFLKELSHEYYPPVMMKLNPKAQYTKDIMVLKFLPSSQICIPSSNGLHASLHECTIALNKQTL